MSVIKTAAQVIANNNGDCDGTTHLPCLPNNPDACTCWRLANALNAAGLLATKSSAPVEKE